MYVYIHVYIDVYTYVCIHLLIFYIFVYACMFVCMHVSYIVQYMCIHVYIYIYKCVSVTIYVSVLFSRQVSMAEISSERNSKSESSADGPQDVSSEGHGKAVRLKAKPVEDATGPPDKKSRTLSRGRKEARRLSVDSRKSCVPKDKKEKRERKEKEKKRSRREPARSSGVVRHRSQSRGRGREKSRKRPRKSEDRHKDRSKACSPRRERRSPSEYTEEAEKKDTRRPASPPDPPRRKKCEYCWKMVSGTPAGYDQHKWSSEYCLQWQAYHAQPEGRKNWPAAVKAAAAVKKNATRRCIRRRDQALSRLAVARGRRVASCPPAPSLPLRASLLWRRSLARSGSPRCSRSRQPPSCVLLARLWSPRASARRALQHRRRRRVPSTPSASAPAPPALAIAAASRARL